MMEKEKRIVLISKCLCYHNDKILMVLRNRPGHPAHNKWELPGGKVEFSEHPLLTAKRETREETGYDVIPYTLIQEVVSNVWDNPDRMSNVVILCYKAILKGGVLSTEDKGGNEVKWFSKDELPIKNDCIEGTYEFLEAFYEGN
jgi:8-oxo-dGTP diphosphatase